MIHAYAIALRTAPPPPPGCRGLGEAPLELLARDDLAAIFSRRDVPPRPTTEQVLAHERVVEAAMARGPVLPFRFGTRLESPEALVALLDARRDELRAALERVRGRVELAVRVLPAPLAAPPSTGAAQASPTRGRDHLRALAARRDAAGRAARELHEPLAALAVDSALREHRPGPAVLVAAYLVEAGRVEAFRRRADELAARFGEHDVVVTGPLPPYSFVGEG